MIVPPAVPRLAVTRLEPSIPWVPHLDSEAHQTVRSLSAVWRSLAGGSQVGSHSPVDGIEPLRTQFDVETFRFRRVRKAADTHLSPLEIYESGGWGFYAKPLLRLGFCIGVAPFWSGTAPWADFGAKGVADMAGTPSGWSRPASHGGSSASETEAPDRHVTSLCNS